MHIEDKCPDFRDQKLIGHCCSHLSSGHGRNHEPSYIFWKNVIRTWSWTRPFENRRLDSPAGLRFGQGRNHYDSFPIAVSMNTPRIQHPNITFGFKRSHSDRPAASVPTVRRGRYQFVVSVFNSIFFSENFIT